MRYASTGRREGCEGVHVLVVWVKVKHIGRYSETGVWEVALWHSPKPVTVPSCPHNPDLFTVALLNRLSPSLHSPRPSLCSLLSSCLEPVSLLVLHHPRLSLSSMLSSPLYPSFISFPFSFPLFHLSFPWSSSTRPQDYRSFHFLSSTSMSNLSYCWIF